MSNAKSAAPPLASFIVLSCNYQNFIGQAITSILNQTIQDLEIIVIDDASSDNSREIVRSFADPRIRLLINDQNMGWTWSYNRAVEIARGEFLINLNAGDWLASNKLEAQFLKIRTNSELDIIGTYCQHVDIDGNPCTPTAHLALINHPHNFNLVDTWIENSPFCRSSALIRRSAHLKIGLYDVTMVRAPDFEFWTRALKKGCRFDIIQEPLIYCRAHTKEIIGNPREAFLETAYTMMQNLLPRIEEQAVYASLAKIFSHIINDIEFSALNPTERYKIIGALLFSKTFDNFAAFTKWLGSHEIDPEITMAGRRCFAGIYLGHIQIHEDYVRLQRALKAKRNPFRRAKKKLLKLYGLSNKIS